MPSGFSDDFTQIQRISAEVVGSAGKGFTVGQEITRGARSFLGNTTLERSDYVVIDASLYLRTAERFLTHTVRISCIRNRAAVRDGLCTLAPRRHYTSVASLTLRFVPTWCYLKSNRSAVFTDLTTGFLH